MNKDIDISELNLNLSEEAKNILRRISVSILDIPNRAKNALVSNGVDNVLNAIEVIKTGFKGFAGVGTKTIVESGELIDDLLAKIKNIEPDLILNVLDPRESYFEHANGNVLQIFRAIIDLPPIS